MAALPLAEGYSVTFRNFDMQKQKEKLLRLEVKGSESVTVAAGTFDCYKAEFASADGGAEKGTLWVSKDSHKPVKMVFVLPSANGAAIPQSMPASP